MTKRQKLYSWGAFVTIIVVAIPILARPWFTKSEEADLADQISVMPVNVKQVNEVESFQLSRRFTGVIRAKQNADLGFELAGKITDVFVDEGDHVAPGQVLASLDTEALKAQRKTVKANLAQAQSRLDELVAGPRKETILAARAEVQAAIAEHENARFNSNRRKQLRQTQSISAEEYDQAVFAEKSAAARLTAAEQRLAELEAGTRVEQISAAKAAVKQLEASIEEIDVSIDKSQLRAAFAGTITKRYLDPGSIVIATAPVIKLQHSSLEAWVGVPVESVTQLDSNDRHDVWVSGKKYSAELKAKVAEIDAATRTQTVIFQLDSAASANVVAGQICKLDVEQTVMERGIWLPTTALTQGIRGLWSVMVVEEQGSEKRAAKRDVEILHTDVDRSLVRGTLVDGEHIIIDGVHRVVAGQLVNPTTQIKSTRVQHVQSEKAGPNSP